MTQICFTTIHVQDMEKALDFYVNKLGFEVHKRDHFPHFVSLKHNLYPIALHQVEKAITLDYPNQAQAVLGISVENLQAKLDELRAQGVDLIHTTPQRFFAGYYAALRDPSGNVHELIELAN